MILVSGSQNAVFGRSLVLGIENTKHTEMMKKLHPECLRCGFSFEERQMVPRESVSCLARS